MNEIPEVKNPIHSAKVIGDNIHNAVYVRNVAGDGRPLRRGDPEYVMSRSELHEFARNPKRWRAGYRDGVTKEKDWGSLIDTLLLLPEHFQERYAVAPATYQDAKTKEQKPWTLKANYCKDWEKGHTDAGREVIRDDDNAEARTAVSVMLNDGEIATLIASGKRSVMVIGEYHDEATGLVIPMKCLIDFLPGLDSLIPKAIVDLKTATSAAPRAWKNAVFEHGYHWQAAIEIDLYVKATGEDRCEFRHWVQENYSPWHVEKHLLDDEFLTLGRMKYSAALRKYAHCLKTNDWPGYEAPERDVIRGYHVTKAEPWMIQ